ncbi:hypothetical protein O3Q51_14015 [Cryomorphaceae bacterium 1068]|nr:hypothetical protein [Cryomorphaceae bacterium 1068]
MRQILLCTAIFFHLSSFSQEWEGIWEIEEFGDTINFEEETFQIQIDTSSTNLWQIGVPSKPILDSAYSPVNALITDTINSYPTSNHSYFDVVFVSEDHPYFLAEQLHFGFTHKYDTDSLRDGGFVTISVDNGVNFDNVFEYDVASYFIPPADNSVNLYTETDTLYTGEPGFSGSSDGWVNTMMGWSTLYLSTDEIGSAKGGWEIDTVLVRFNFISDSIAESKDGWIIDDFYIFKVDVLSNVRNTTIAQFKIFPNPATDMITAETEKDYQNLEMKIRSISGSEAVRRAYGNGNRVQL